MKKATKKSVPSFHKKAFRKKVPLKRVESHLEKKLLDRLTLLNFHSAGLAATNEFPSLNAIVPLSFPCTLSVKRNYRPFLHRGNEMEMDFAWPEVKIGIEVNGGIDMRGRAGGHTSPEGLRRDYYKSNLAQVEGWILLTFPPEYCTDDQQASVGIRLLRAAFKLRGVELK